MKGLLAHAASALGVPALLRRRQRGQLVVLMHHGVSPAPLDPACWHVQPEAQLAAQLSWVARHYDVRPLDEALRALDAGALERPTAAITFDDGFQSNHALAWPLLRRLGLPATIFLATGAIDTDDVLWPDRLHLVLARTDETSVDATSLGLGTLSLATSAARAASIGTLLRHLKTMPTDAREIAATRIEASLGGFDGHPGPFRMLTWQEVSEMAEDPLIRFGAHTRTHPILSRTDDRRIQEEIEGSLADVRARIDEPSPVFAYPNGRAIDFDDRAKQAVANAGLRWAVSTETGPIDRGDDPHALRRLPIGSDLSLARFRLLVSAGR